MTVIFPNFMIHPGYQLEIQITRICVCLLSHSHGYSLQLRVVCVFGLCMHCWFARYGVECCELLS